MCEVARVQSRSASLVAPGVGLPGQLPEQLAGEQVLVRPASIDRAPRPPASRIRSSRLMCSRLTVSPVRLTIATAAFSIRRAVSVSDRDGLD
jgi:hypothetical protein